jgi:NAD(P)-dependent dehydrogenase (short-subunit alcohol dehydrogenase family)
MTDIRKHLPEIFKLVRTQLRQCVADDNSQANEFDEAAYIALRQTLVEFLPASYGVGAGVVVGANGRLSQPLELVLYDRTIPVKSNLPENAVCAVSQVLAVFEVRLSYEASSLALALAKISSVKELRPPRPLALPTVAPIAESGGRQALSIPKQILPLGVVFCLDWKFWQNANANIGVKNNNIAESETATEQEKKGVKEKAAKLGHTEALCVALNKIIRQHSQATRPDYMFVLDAAVSYRNPVLEGIAVLAYDSGLAREPELTKPAQCYVCRSQFYRRQFFYDYLCPRCGDFNYFKRYQSADLSGKLALVTGARVKIGYAVALKLLRAGASVIATTRFPHDAALRYSQEPDFEQWSQRLHIYGVDLRHIAGLEEFIRYLQQVYARLDILVNNAAQTVRRPPAFYAHLLPFELLDISELPAQLQPLLNPTEGFVFGDAVNQDPTEALLGINQALTIVGNKKSAAELSQIPLVSGDEVYDTALFPPDQYDQYHQQLDRRTHHSWTMKLAELSTPEIVEVQFVNVVAPTLLISQLKPLLQKGVGPKHIINVSAAEGQFKPTKQVTHPHTNMAKAALNMLTHTIAADYAESSIFVNSVDPGWVSWQLPYGDATETTFELPIDEVDAAARICDPIFSNLDSAQPYAGRFFKDYIDVGGGV